LNEEEKKLFEKKKTGDLKLLSKDSNETENNKGEYIGSYKKIGCFDDFKDFLKVEGYNIVFVSLKQQLDYITNFLNIGNCTVISVNKELEQVLKRDYIKGITVDYLDFEAVKNLYGAIHCASQVSRGSIFKIDIKDD